MKRLLDLRFVIGVFFLVVGMLLLIHGFTAMNETDVNRWCGGIFSLFGIVMIIMSMQGDAHELLENDGH